MISAVSFPVFCADALSLFVCLRSPLDYFFPVVTSCHCTGAARNGELFV